MYRKRIFISCFAVLFFTSAISESYGQEGLPVSGDSYYQPRVAANYPLLTGGRSTANDTIVRSTEVNAQGIDSRCGCSSGIPLLTALTQRLRDTLRYIFPFRNTNQMGGLFFSERFYGSNCCGDGQLISDVIYEDGPGEIPTPATPIEEVPAKVIPTTSAIFPGPQGRIATPVSVGNGVRSNVVRPINYSVPSYPNADRIRSIPVNPLRR